MIIEAGIDHRMQDQCCSVVLILVLCVDEVKWLSELATTFMQQDFHGAEGFELRALIEFFRLSSAGFC